MYPSKLQQCDTVSVRTTGVSLIWNIFLAATMQQPESSP